MTATKLDPQTILKRWQEIQAAGGVRARDAAAKIGVSEGELVGAQIGQTATRLRNDFKELFAELPALGEVMALTRNEACVHERKGEYLGSKFFEQGPIKMGLLANEDIDLRLFMGHWRHTFACKEPTAKDGGFKRSLQFFDKEGTAIHKIHMMPNSNADAFDALIEKFSCDDQSPIVATEAYPAKAAEKPDDQIDWTGLRKDWEEMNDVHQFHGMLRKYGVSREQSFRKIGADFAYPVANKSSNMVLELTRDSGFGLMVFVGNRGCIQIHTGTIHKVMDHGPWHNVLDPKFNLHLNSEHIASSWVVKKPTADGIVSALEVFDKDGEIIVTFFGKRKPGQKELEPWRDVLAQLPKI